MQLMMERSSIDKPLTFEVSVIQLNFYHCVHLVCSKVFSTQMYNISVKLHLGRVSIFVLFIIVINCAIYVHFQFFQVCL